MDNPIPKPSVLVVAEDAGAARAIAASLAEVTRARSEALAPGGAHAHPADVVVLAFASMDANGQHARSLRGAEEGAPATAAGSATLFRSSPVLVLRCQPAEAEAAARLVRNGLVDDYVADDGADSQRLPTTVFTAMRFAAIRPAPRSRPLVLMVEDDEVSQVVVSAMLAADGIELVCESDGAAVLDRIRERRPDLVLMDVMLPGSNGVELTQRLKADASLASIPIVMVTGEARRDTLVRSMEAGAADFVVKPFTPEALRNKLAKFLPSPA